MRVPVVDLLLLREHRFLDDLELQPVEQGLELTLRQVKLFQQLDFLLRIRLLNYWLRRRLSAQRNRNLESKKDFAMKSEGTLN